MRWRLRFGAFDFSEKYKKGRLNTQADALSRLPTTGGTVVPMDEDIPCYHTADLDKESGEEEDSFVYVPDAIDYAEGDALWATQTYSFEENQLTPINREELRRHQLTDPFFAAVRRALNGWDRVPFSLANGGILVRTVHARPQIVVSEDLQPRVLHIGHHVVTSGHSRVKTLYRTLSRDFY